MSGLSFTVTVMVAVPRFPPEEESEHQSFARSLTKAAVHVQLPSGQRKQTPIRPVFHNVNLRPAGNQDQWKRQDKLARFLIAKHNGQSMQ